jgi:hypothetical protein
MRTAFLVNKVHTRVVWGTLPLLVSRRVPLSRAVEVLTQFQPEVQG